MGLLLKHSSYKRVIEFYEFDLVLIDKTALPAGAVGSMHRF